MFSESLIESAGQKRSKRTVATTIVSMAIHALIVFATVAAGYWVHENPDATEPIQAYIIGSAPPPPPPPPPPPGGGESAPEPEPEMEEPEPDAIEPENTFVTPQEIPDEVPDVEPSESEAQEGGIPGGEEGGVIGGVVGGVVGGVIGGEIGGQLGGVLGGTGTGPYTPGGNVTPPVAVYKPEPGYTEDARKARTQGIVILEMIVDEKGEVRDVKVLKPLPNGLTDEAIKAVKGWRYRPGLLDGEPVPVIFNVSVSFRLQ
ncbi:MAG: energy transducer TonB [Thermoanaerobaculia bacterium]|nr:energy transducer TonB [Thermoanaerobaculia bacterium]